MPVHYLTNQGIAAWFNVSPRTVEKWRERYPNLPEPDVYVAHIPGWSTDSEPRWRAWYEVHGPGAARRTNPGERRQD